MTLSDVYIVVFSFIWAVLIGGATVGLELLDGVLATLLTLFLFLGFVAAGVVLRQLLGIDW